MSNIRTMLTVEESAKIAKSTEALIRQELRAGKLKGTKVGKEWRIAKRDLDEYLGIELDEESVKRELYIKELEGKVRHLEFVLNSVKTNLDNLNFVLGEK